MLTPKQKAILKSKANTLKPVYQIGKDGISDELITGILNYLAKHELMKINLLNNSMVTKEEFISAMEENDIEFVSKIGHIFTVYKYSPDLESHIEL